MTRSRRTAREAGTRFERLIADWLKVRLNNDNIDRRTRNGRLDRGDIGQVRAALGGRIVLELKDAARHDLSGWLEEAEIEAANDDALLGVVVSQVAILICKWNPYLTGITFSAGARHDPH